MKVTFQTQDLCRALERVQRAAQTKVTSNTNNGFFISAEDGKVEFQANDYSIGIRTFVKLMWKSGDPSLFRHPIFCLP